MSWFRVRVIACAMGFAASAVAAPAGAQVASKSGTTASAAVQEPDQTLAAFADLKATVSDVKTLYGGLSSYAKIVNFWEEKISGRVSSRNAFGGQAVVEAYGSTDEMFMVTYTKVPRNACIRMMAKNPDDDIQRTYIGTVEGPFTVESASVLCHDETVVSWVHR